MPTIRLLDDLNAPLLDVDTPRSSGLGRYLPEAVSHLRAIRSVAGAFRTRLSEASTNPVALEFATPEGIRLGQDGALTIDAGARAAVGVHQPDELLFPADDLRDAISVPGGTAYVSVGLAPRVKVGLEGERGPLSFGFAGGAALTVRYLHPVDIAGTDPTVANALADTLRAAVVPADLDDLAALPVGSHASVEGAGEVELSAAVEFASVANPLATPGLPIVGSIGVSAGASVSVGARWRASGTFEVRASRMAPDRVRLSYYKRAGSEVAVDATAALGVGVSIRDSDAIALLMRAISSDPQADVLQLVNAGLTDAQIEGLQRAIAGSVDRSLRTSLEMQFSSVRRGEALFAYDVDLSGLDDNGKRAVADALRGRLTAIHEAAAADGPIRAVQTGILRLRARRVAWRINLFGLLNVHGIGELLRKGTLSYDPETGTLNAADEISSRKILVKTRPFESDGEKVRKLAFESMIVTAAYHASRVTSGVSLTCGTTYFESHRRTSRAEIREHYNAIIGMGLADRAEAERRMGPQHDFGPSTFFLDCVFDQNASDALFFGPQGAFTRDYYERVGRDALLALIPADDVDRAHRRAAVEQEASWTALTAAGPAAGRVDLVRRLGEIRAEHIIGDFVTIQWWAEAMGDAARALVEMRQFLAGRTAASLAADPQFARRRSTLEKQLADVVKESKARFGDPWGLLALDMAANRAARAQATIVSPRLTASYAERAAGTRAALRRAAPAARAAFGAREEKRPFTADERELLRRYAINLRFGAFSDDGEFQTSAADARRIFTELIPEEIARRKAAGEKARLMFYAHGGLTDEREGLEPVLKRLKFWRQNNVYPLSFVWETGLRETITDIVRGLAGARDVAARGVGEDLADAFIEFAGRQGGRRVWGQMKRSAELAVLDGGGGRLIAELTRDLWAAHHADLELHAAGHSAGTIFQAHFLPAVLRQSLPAGAPPIIVKTLHFLAPACTNALFESTLMPLIGPGKPVPSMTMYTMNETLEKEDEAGPYRKSLLYLVSRAFENEQPARILGLEESLREDPRTIRFFGLAGNQKQADLLFSKSPANAPARDRTLSTTHGGFDDDAATMTSVMRRVLDVPDTAPIVDFFQEDLAPVAAQPNVGDTVAAAIERTSTAVAPPVATPAAPAAPAIIVPAAGRPARRALCVGIDKYGPPYDLAGCVNDVRNWAKALSGLSFEVTSLHDEAATRSAVLAAFRSLVTSAQPGDVIVFQYAGHGTQVDDVDGDETDSLDEAFCPADFAQGRLLIDDDIRSAVAELKPGVNLTCFIDCCHSGTITRAIVPGGRASAVPPGSRARYIPYSREISDRHRQFRTGGGAALATGDTPRVTPESEAALKEVCFSACQPHEVAYETGGAGQFTTRAMTVLSSGGSLTNIAFMEQVTAAFGARPPQHPYLDCAEEAKTLALLGSLVVPG